VLAWSTGRIGYIPEPGSDWTGGHYWLQYPVRCQISRVSLNLIFNWSDWIDVVTRSIWKSVRWQPHYNPIDLKSVGLQWTGTIYLWSGSWGWWKSDGWTATCFIWMRLIDYWQRRRRWWRWWRMSWLLKIRWRWRRAK